MSGSIVVLSLIMHVLLDRENKRRDRVYGPVVPNAEIDVSEQGDYNRQFRYMT
jgi:hypothetical protein